MLTSVADLGAAVSGGSNLKATVSPLTWTVLVTGTRVSGSWMVTTSAVALLRSNPAGNVSVIALIESEASSVASNWKRVGWPPVCWSR